MSDPAFKEVAILGIGLLGGSLGLAIKERGLAGSVVGIGRSQKTLDEAVRIGIVDRATTDLGDGLRGADFVILCTPVRHILQNIDDVIDAARAGAIMTDVGSTKGSIVAAGEPAARRSGKFFVGSHPMAGSEKSGMHYSRANLYEDSTCFVTKTPDTDLAAFARVCAFWSALDSRVVIARPERHDHLTAMVSHLPHLVAVALTRAVANSQEDKNLIKGIIGNGFRDTTRIAQGNTSMWDDICADNSNEIGAARKALDQAMQEIVLRCGGVNSDLKVLLEEASDYREFLNNR
jgi:prephenate dehydrogenase